MATIIQFPKRQHDAPELAATVIGNTVIRFPAPEREPEPEPPAKPARRKRGNTKEEDQRLAMLGKVHIALPILYRECKGFSEDVYRFALQERWGVSSSADMTNRQLHELLQYLGKLGWLPKKGRNRKDAPATLDHDPTGMSREDKMGKIEAFLAEKGRREGTDVPWGYAVNILKRQTLTDPGGQVKQFEKASHKQLDAVIAALYRDAKRRGRRVR